MDSIIIIYLDFYITSNLILDYITQSQNSISDLSQVLIIPIYPSSNISLDSETLNPGTKPISNL